MTHMYIYMDLIKNPMYYSSKYCKYNSTDTLWLF